MTTTTEKSARQPVMYVPHGGGPWPFVDMGGFMPDARHRRRCARTS